MKRQTVESSTIKEIGYDEPTGTLEILFSSGGTYQYAEVPKETFETFMRTESKGYFFQACIRPCFACTRVHLETCGAPQGETCAQDCECFCHKQRKDVSHGQSTEKAQKDTANKAGRKAKPPRPPV